jgi:hypothetical protein
VKHSASSACPRYQHRKKIHHIRCVHDHYPPSRGCVFRVVVPSLSTRYPSPLLLPFTRMQWQVSVFGSMCISGMLSWMNRGNPSRRCSAEVCEVLSAQFHHLLDHDTSCWRPLWSVFAAFTIFSGMSWIVGGYLFVLPTLALQRSALPGRQGSANLLLQIFTVASVTCGMRLGGYTRRYVARMRWSRLLS